MEDAQGIPKAEEMVRELSEDQERVVESTRQVIEAAEAAGDQASADLGVRRIEIHEKNAWMLRSHLE